ncbi:MAG: hypothetical protein NTX61_17475 [Bacteroidetes bacterium]|nr:hypothetical protein [Bacteroidota bacterium]
MKINMITVIAAVLFIITGANCQVTQQLQDAINNVPTAKYAYPANRDRDSPPQVASPQAYAYAYYHLPYAIDLATNYDELTDGYLSKVIVNFKSVNLSAAEEKRMLKKAVLELQDLLDRQYATSRRAGFTARTNFSRSMVSRFVSNGQAIIAIREILSTRDLIDKLVRRRNLI